MQVLSSGLNSSGKFKLKLKLFSTLALLRRCGPASGTILYFVKNFSVLLAGRFLRRTWGSNPYFPEEDLFSKQAQQTNICLLSLSTLGSLRCGLASGTISILAFAAQRRSRQREFLATYIQNRYPQHYRGRRGNRTPKASYSSTVFKTATVTVLFVLPFNLFQKKKKAFRIRNAFFNILLKSIYIIPENIYVKIYYYNSDIVLPLASNFDVRATNNSVDVI